MPGRDARARKGNGIMEIHKRLTEMALDKRRAAKISRLQTEDKGASGYLNHRLADALDVNRHPKLSTNRRPILSTFQLS